MHADKSQNRLPKNVSDTQRQPLTQYVYAENRIGFSGNTAGFSRVQQKYWNARLGRTTFMLASGKRSQPGGLPQRVPQLAQGSRQENKLVIDRYAMSHKYAPLLQVEKSDSFAMVTFLQRPLESAPVLLHSDNDPPARSGFAAKSAVIAPYNFETQDTRMPT